MKLMFHNTDAVIKGTSVLVTTGIGITSRTACKASEDDWWVDSIERGLKYVTIHLSEEVGGFYYDTNGRIFPFRK